MVSLFSRKKKVIRLPVRIGEVILKDQHEEPSSAATRIILALALNMVKSKKRFTFQRMERFDFGILSARWRVEGGFVSVTIYLDSLEGKVEVHSGMNSAENQITVVSDVDCLVSAINLMVETEGLYLVRWAA